MPFLERDDGVGAERPLLEVDELCVRFGRRQQIVHAVDGVSLRIAPGESVGLVGESGCGKTTLGRAVVRLQAPSSGRIAFRGADLAALRGADLKRYRGRVQMVFQDPYGSLNPRMSVGAALEEVLKAHGTADAAERRQRAAGLLADVGLDAAYLTRYPHEFSGGQRQRVGIARALAVNPELVIADEPVSALDVSVQVQILNLLKDLQRQRKLAYLLVAHDLAVVRYVCERVLVMYLGRIVESAPSSTLYTQPAHPYSQMLLRAVPDVDKGLRSRRAGTGKRRAPPESSTAQRPEQGCLFAPRCALARARCRAETPALREVARDRWSACHFAEEVWRSTWDVGS